ncbi:MAG: hypothetical protein WC360_02000 [Opitutales bacterium]|jgi:membrane protein involved in colicin uptake
MKHSRNYSIYFYLVAPVLLLVIFATYYNRFQTEQKAEQARQELIDQQKAEEAAKEQADMEKRLDAEAKMIAEAKAKAIADKEAKDKAERQAKVDDLTTRIATTQGDLDRLSANNTDLDSKITATRSERIATESDWLAKAKDLERERAVKSATDLEAQRLIGMIMDRFESDWAKILTEAPPLPATGKSR